MPGQSHPYVIVDNSNLVSTVVTHLPAYTNGNPGELQQTILIITNRGYVSVSADERVRDILVYTNCFVSLSNCYLRVRAKEHHLDDRQVFGPGATNRTDFYSHIIWEGSGGTVIVIR